MSIAVYFPYILYVVYNIVVEVYLIQFRHVTLSDVMYRNIQKYLTKNWF